MIPNWTNAHILGENVPTFRPNGLKLFGNPEREDYFKGNPKSWKTALFPGDLVG